MFILQRKNLPRFFPRRRQDDRTLGVIMRRYCCGFGLSKERFICVLHRLKTRQSKIIKSHVIIDKLFIISERLAANIFVELLIFLYKCQYVKQKVNFPEFEFGWKLYFSISDFYNFHSLITNLINKKKKMSTISINSTLLYWNTNKCKGSDLGTTI